LTTWLTSRYFNNTFLKVRHHHFDADKNIGKEIVNLNGCFTCHGGNSKGLSTKVSHKGANKLTL